MKKIKLLILIFLILLSFGCSKTTKEEIKPDTLKVILENYSFTVLDSSSKFGYADYAYYAERDSGKIKLNYVRSIKKYDIQGIFLDECKNVYNTCEQKYKKKIQNGKNWANLTVTDSKNYYFVGWIGNSYITIVSPKEDEAEINKLVIELGYKS